LRRKSLYWRGVFRVRTLGRGCHSAKTLVESRRWG
jgi:hypothetical protein